MSAWTPSAIPIVLNYMTTKELLKELKKRIKKEVGTNCENFYIECFTCRVWMAVDILEDCLEE